MNNKPLKGVAQKTGLGPDSDQARWVDVGFGHAKCLKSWGKKL